MKNIFETMNNIEVQIGETAKEREDFLSKSVNNFLDRVYFGTHSILHQILSPIHGFTYEELRILVDAVKSYAPSANVPVAICIVDLLKSLDKAKQEGNNAIDDIVSKIVGLGNAESSELCYRVYVYLRFKQIMTECFKEF